MGNAGTPHSLWGLLTASWENWPSRRTEEFLLKSAQPNLCLGAGLRRRNYKMESCPTLATPRTVARQAPLSLGFSRQEDWCGLPFPPPGDLPAPRTELRSPTLQAHALPTKLRRKLSNGAASLDNINLMDYCYYYLLIMMLIIILILLIILILWRRLKNFKEQLVYNPAIPLLGIYPKEINSIFHRAICDPMFFAA